MKAGLSRLIGHSYLFNGLVERCNPFFTVNSFSPLVKDAVDLGEFVGGCGK